MPRPRTHYNNDAIFSKIETEEQSYLLGLLCADGYLTKNGYAIDLNEQDLELLWKVKRITDFGGEPYPTNHGMYRLYLTSHQAHQDLRNYGLTFTKSRDLSLDPTAVVPSTTIRHFTRGYFDGDGSWTDEKTSSVVKGKRYEYTRTRAYLRGTSVFLENLKQSVEAQLAVQFSYHRRKHPAIYLSEKKAVTTFGEWLYQGATIYLERKYQTYLQRHE